MIRTQKSVPDSGVLILFLVLANVIAIREGYTGDSNWYLSLIVTLPVLLLAIQKKQPVSHTKSN